MKKGLIYTLLLLCLTACHSKPPRTVRILTSSFYINTKTYKQDIMPILYLEISDTGNVKCMVRNSHKGEKMYLMLDLSHSLKQRLLDMASSDSIYEPYPWEKDSNPPNHILFNIELRKDTTVKICSYYYYASNKQQQQLIREVDKLCYEVSKNYRYILLNTKFDINDFIRQTKQNLPTTAEPGYLKVLNQK